MSGNFHLYLPLLASLLGVLLYPILPLRVNTPFWTVQFDVDSLSLYYSIIVTCVSLCVSVYTVKYGEEYKKKVYIFPITSLFILSMLLTIFSYNSLTFLFFWELMSLFSFILVIAEENVKVERAGFLYFFMTHIGTAFILISFMLLYFKSGSFDFYYYRGKADSLILTLALLGFSIKAGLFPFHVWLPHAHPVAPSHVSALMSAVMLKVAVYGMLRFILEFAHEQHVFLALLFVICGGVSAIYGSLYMLGERDIKKMLAYSSIENIGLIGVAIGIAQWALKGNHTAVFQYAMTFILLHSLMHALIKSGLFMGAGLLLKYTHERCLDRMGGLSKSSPSLFLLMLLYSASISALPLSGIFLSELFLYKTLIDSVATKENMSFLLTLLVPVVAISGVFVVFSSVKFLGLVFLGKNRGAGMRVKPSSLEVVSLAIPVVLSLAIGLDPFVYYNLLSKLFALTVGPLDYRPVELIPLSVFTVFVLYILSKGAGERTYETWLCGLEEENPKAQATVLSLTYSTRRVFSMFFRTLSEISFEEDVKKYFRKRLKFREESEDLVEATVYEPLGRFVLRTADSIRTVLQSGNLNHYIAFIFLTLVLNILLFMFLLGVK
ncbi:NADH/Ubiquinone/plastoquinone (complex I) [Thermocrinis albus DSM 14484]|uniref:NADH/Ubiquinone/plastoquinone (Complex I) n=1 Tax=Thermocrinis albus (strain DSM 14484 / JCM 11386 / HI 11/12) TaxID=638303 RepID=D3SMR9_THEAH|nr:proton-conducting transporter membrane subunit [Thermocrinis albus]ADC90049.1 NADH/Ubiquinone/plastoquinone (complex I) [Thermocrinis albus DSM 14484]